MEDLTLRLDVQKRKVNFRVAKARGKLFRGGQDWGMGDDDVGLGN